jgi:hypothetical protein
LLATRSRFETNLDERCWSCRSSRRCPEKADMVEGRSTRHPGSPRPLDAELSRNVSEGAARPSGRLIGSGGISLVLGTRQHAPRFAHRGK